jgi:hypothetical protein
VGELHFRCLVCGKRDSAAGAGRSFSL